MLGGVILVLVPLVALLMGVLLHGFCRVVNCLLRFVHLRLAHLGRLVHGVITILTQGFVLFVCRSAQAGQRRPQSKP